MKLSACLSDLGIDDATPLEGCDDLDEEFKALRKLYLNKVRAEHPDKGGDPAVFRKTQTAWEVLRDQYDAGSIRGGTFTSYLGTARAADDVDDADLEELYRKYASNTSVPSYEYFDAAAEEAVPGYRVELAKSGRSKCNAKGCKGNIPKDEIRVGSLDKVAGTYGRWHHLDCWRVPVKVQNGLTDPSDEATSVQNLLSMEEILLTGVGELSDANQRLFAQHCMNREHWARNRKRKQIMGAAGGEGGASKGAKVASKAESASRAPGSASAVVGGASTIVPGSFAVLIPGVDGALDDDKLLKGKTIVISGVFPEAGGGEADEVGVANVKAMIQSFGGKVTSRFSKKTNFLLVGKDPAAGKIGDAAKRSPPVDVLSLRRLQGLLLGHVTFASLKRMPSLTSAMFVGGAYQPAGAPPPAPKAAASAFQVNGGANEPAAAAKAPPKAKPAAAKAPPAASTAASASAQALVVHANPGEGAASTTAVVPHAGKKAKFTMPRPGVAGAQGSDLLDGKRFVLTGVFPEIGGGTGLTLGKDRTTPMIESFGGRVTSAVSGKTDYLLVGKDPGRSKVSKADQRGIPMLNLISLHRLLMGNTSLEAVASEPPPRITNFSAGYPTQKQIGY